MSSSFGPLTDSWSRRPSRPQPKVMGVDLNSRRATILVLLGGTLLSAAILSARYQLAHPDDHPYGISTRIGLQAYEASFRLAAAETGSPTDMPHYDQPDYDEWGTLNAGDWDEDGEEETDWLLPFQKDEWDPTAINPMPLTEITLKSCVLPPSFYDLCAPVSTKAEDATRGKWVRVDRDINRRNGIYFLYLFTRRLLPNSPAAVITNITLLDHSPTDDDLSAGGMWTEVSQSIREGLYPRMTPMFLHYKVTDQDEVKAARRVSPNNDAGELEPITEIDILYGGPEVKPLYGYEAINTFITGGEDDDKAVSLSAPDKGRVGSRLAIRRAPVALPSPPSLRFSAEGNFTILQVADLHFSVGPGECRDLDPERERLCKQVGADNYSLRWLETALEEVQPDFVVFSGDQSNGQDTSWSSQATILKWAPILWERRLPWTVIFGNHDGEVGLSLEDQMALMRKMPYFMGEAGPDGVDGTGNYMRSIRSHDLSNTTLFNLYFLDSHATAKSLNPWAKGYDWLKASQINWFKGQSSRVKTIRRPYVAPVEPLTPIWGSGRKAKKPRPKPKPVATVQDSDFDNRRRQTDYEEGPGDDELLPATTEAETLEEEEEAAELAEIEAESEADADSTPVLAAGDGDERDDALDSTYAVAAAPGSQNDDGMLRPAVEPYDPNDAKDAPDPADEPTFEESDVTKGSVEMDGPQGDGPEADGDVLAPLAPFDDLDYWDNTPTVLPAGPTRANPMEAKPNAITFFHIPLPESYDGRIDVGENRERLIVGERFEGNGAPKTNSGFFEQALLSQGELPEPDNSAPVDEFWEGEFSAPTTGRPEVKVVANGHCHISEDCRRVQGVWLCFGGGGSYSGYGKAGFARRMRVYQLSEYGERIETYKLLDTKERIDLTVLAGEESMYIPE